VFLFLLGFLLRCHGSILPSIFHGLRNVVLLQLIECIESLKSDVKKKMMLTCAPERCTKVTKERKREICVALKSGFRLQKPKSVPNFTSASRERTHSAAMVVVNCIPWLLSLDPFEAIQHL
jgi:hypothetical protein